MSKKSYYPRPVRIDVGVYQEPGSSYHGYTTIEVREAERQRSYLVEFTYTDDAFLAKVVDRNLEFIRAYLIKKDQEIMDRNYAEWDLGREYQLMQDEEA